MNSEVRDICINISFNLKANEKDEKELKDYLKLFIEMSLPQWLDYDPEITDVEVK